MSTPRPAISLALGGGGAKGIVHIGVLQAIEEQQLQVASIVGTSVGAIWAALFANAVVAASGEACPQKRAIETVTQFAYQFRFREYRDISIKALFTKGFVKGKQFEDWLGTILGNWETGNILTFRNLDFDLTVTATDAATGENLVFNRLTTPHLPVARAVRASMSIQGFFEDVTADMPQPGGGMTAVRCWDGGTTGNCRFDLAYSQYPDRPVIASSVTYRGEPVEVDKGLLRVPWRLSRIRDHSISILMRQIESLLEKYEGHDRILIIRPPLQGITTFDFDMPNPRKADAITAACAYANDAITEFRKRHTF